MSIVDVFSKLIWLSPMLKKNVLFSVAVFKKCSQRNRIKTVDDAESAKLCACPILYFYFQNYELSE